MWHIPGASEGLGERPSDNRAGELRCNERKLNAQEEKPEADLRKWNAVPHDAERHFLSLPLGAVGDKSMHCILLLLLLLWLFSRD
jgi:hypothetical protein